jgi:hypothetical protein
MPLHISAIGWRALHAPHAPAAQTSVPEPQTVEHGRVSPSSTMPLQLLSMLSQISGDGDGDTHEPNAPALQYCVPMLQIEPGG